MSEEVARALSAASSTTITIAGKECVVRPLGIQELSEVERDCVKRYKRQYLETFSQNADLLPDGQGMALLEKKIEEVSRWDVDDLPHKTAYDPSKIQLVDKLKDWVVESLNISDTKDDDRLKVLVAASMDRGTLSDDDYRRMVGNDPPKVNVDYVNWWVTGNYEGMITFVWVCFRSQGVTREQIVESLRGDMSLLIDLTREIERLSAPQAGNG
jgi:hypothetical protein